MPDTQQVQDRQQKLYDSIQSLRAGTAKASTMDPLKRYVETRTRGLCLDDKADVFNRLLLAVYKCRELPEVRFLYRWLRQRLLNAMTQAGYIRDERYRAGRDPRPVSLDEYDLEFGVEDPAFDRIDIIKYTVWDGPETLFEPEE